MVDLFVYSYLRTCAAYDSTIKAIGFDEVRVRYREKRRALIRGVILQKLLGEQLDHFLQEATQELVPQKDQEAFIENVYEDLKQIDESRLVGLGVTPEQLLDWKS